MQDGMRIDLQERNRTAGEPENHIEWLDWLAREQLIAALGRDLQPRRGLARVDSNHHFWIQSPASCH